MQCFWFSVGIEIRCLHALRSWSRRGRLFEETRYHAIWYWTQSGSLYQSTGKFSLKATNKNNAVQWAWISHLLMTIFCFQLTYGSIAIGRSLFGTRKPNPIVRPIRRRQLVRVTKEQTSTRFKNGSSEQSATTPALTDCVVCDWHVVCGCHRVPAIECVTRNRLFFKSVEPVELSKVKKGVKTKQSRRR